MPKARNLKPGDVFALEVCGEVISVASVADGKRIKVKIALEDQCQIEFPDASLTLEFLSRPGRKFNVYKDYGDWDDDDDEPEPGPVPDDDELEPGPVPTPEDVDA
jgi:hypothetical protein